MPLPGGPALLFSAALVVVVVVVVVAFAPFPSACRADAAQA